MRRSGVTRKCLQMASSGDTGTHTACYADVVAIEGWAGVRETPCEGQKASNLFEAWTCNVYLSNLGSHTTLFSRTSQPSSRFVSPGLHLSSSGVLSSLAINELPFLTWHALALPARCIHSQDMWAQSTPQSFRLLISFRPVATPSYSFI